MEKIKKSMRALLDVIFEVLYIAVMILAILDIFGLFVFVQSDGWMKILVLIFATVGLVTISDKKRLEENIEPELTRISDVQNSEIGSVKKIEDNSILFIFMMGKVALKLQERALAEKPSIRNC